LFVTIFFTKSLLSLALLASAVLAVYSMFEVLGRGAATAVIGRFKRLHKITGYLYLFLFLLLSYLCIGFAAASQTEPSPRAALHILLALAIIVLILVKVLFVRIYRQFYGQAKIIGILIGVMTFVLVGISGGFYLTVSRFGRDRTTDKSIFYTLQGPFLSVKKEGAPGIMTIRSDRLSIEQGRKLFASRCAGCHDPLSTRAIVGPGLKGLLKNPVLPISKNPATAESIRFQLRQPMGRMPSFAYLSAEEIENLIAYLNTL
jgi:hypothetical protein